jgi:hypothetical protein
MTGSSTASIGHVFSQSSKLIAWLGDAPYNFSTLKIISSTGFEIEGFEQDKLIKKQETREERDIISR